MRAIIGALKATSSGVPEASRLRRWYGDGSGVTANWLARGNFDERLSPAEIPVVEMSSREPA
jgi:hypothetical protein